MVLNNLNTRVKGAEKGKNLLERKCEALKMRHKEVAAELYAKKLELEEKIEKALFQFRRIELYGGDVRLAIHQANTLPLNIVADMQSITGMAFPTLSLQKQIKPMYFLGASGRLIGECRTRFLECLSLMVSIGSTQLTFTLLDQLVYATNRRVSALEHVLIPRLENTIRYIQSELDELDREEFFRLKKVQNKKNAPEEQEHQ